MQALMFLSAAATKKIAREVQHHVHEDLLCLCLSGDIWSENGISMFGLNGYWIDSDMNYREALLHCAPFTNQRHTGANIRKLTIDALVSPHSRMYTFQI